MPVTCIVAGCKSRAERNGVRFFSVPAVKYNRFLTVKNELSRKRRDVWIAALKRLDLTESKLKNQRVCSKHFITGKPASLEDENNPDWVPSQQMSIEAPIIKKEIAEIEEDMQFKRRELIFTPSLEDETNPDWVPSQQMIIIKKEIADVERDMQFKRRELTPTQRVKRPFCAVLGCVPSVKDSVFIAPSPKQSWDLLIAWIKATGNPRFLDVSKRKQRNVFICQKHFTDEDLAILRNRTKSCIPTLNIPAPLNLHLGIDANIPDSSNLVSANLEEPPNTEADNNTGFLTALTCKTKDVERSGVSLRCYSSPKPQQVVLHDNSPKPKPVFFPLFDKISPKLIDSSKLNSGMDATNSERSRTFMLSRQQKRKDTPINESSDRKRKPLRILCNSCQRKEVMK
ncbi:unnamed protein product [Callosobruchus maculatus]|uniref:THAP-type domain-containing protein n=1 Tax=Callosobruchus maculatus TaxID=64391 RepID=A0A653C009_CALMS|nr:unnamed protein product [Callosobruchus maculatus]